MYKVLKLNIGGNIGKLIENGNSKNLIHIKLSEGLCSDKLGVSKDVSWT